MEEREIKFLVGDLAELESRLQKLGAELEKPRIYESNLRFDTAGGELIRQAKLLRLRQDDRVRITYKEPGEVVDGIRVRPEIEIEVSDYAATRQLFEALGYQIRFIYEKFRTQYQFAGVQVLLDETPLGDFIELEGPDGETIRRASAQLRLDWEHRILESYTYLFQLAKVAIGFSFRDMTFQNFETVTIKPEIFGVARAD